MKRRSEAKGNAEPPSGLRQKSGRILTPEALAHLAINAARAMAKKRPGLAFVVIVAPADGEWLGCGSNAPPADVDAMLLAAIRMGGRTDYLPTLKKTRR